MSKPTFVKKAPAGSLAAEANGLRWLAAATAGGGVPVPEVLAVDEHRLVTAYLPPERPTPAMANQFGARLATTHAAGSDAFGAPWPGWIASLPLDNSPGISWPEWYAQRRLTPYLRRARDAGDLEPADAKTVETVIDRIADLAGPREPPARIHGDLWSGNLLWSAGQGWLIEPGGYLSTGHVREQLPAPLHRDVPGESPGKRPGHAAAARSTTPQRGRRPAAGRSALSRSRRISRGTGHAGPARTAGRGPLPAGRPG